MNTMRKYIISVLIVTLIWGTLQAQTTGKKTKKDAITPVAQRLFEEALDGCFVILQRDYQLEDTNGVRYGWNGEITFSTTFSLGICTEEGIIVSDDFFSPWENDINFADFRKSMYYPVATTAFYHELKTEDKERILFPIEIDTLSENLSRFPSPADMKSFAIDSTGGTKSGFLIYILGDGKLDEKPVSGLEYHFVKTDLDISSLETMHIPNDSLPKVDKKILGGIYVKPDIGLGFIYMRLVGVILHTNDEWTVVTPFIKKAISQDNDECETNNE